MEGPFAQRGAKLEYSFFELGFCPPPPNFKVGEEVLDPGLEAKNRIAFPTLIFGVGGKWPGRHQGKHGNTKTLLKFCTSGWDLKGEFFPKYCL